MPSDPSLTPALLRTVERLVRGAGPGGISSTHLIQACSDESAQVARHLAALIADKKVLELSPGGDLLSASFAPAPAKP